MEVESKEMDYGAQINVAQRYSIYPQFFLEANSNLLSLTLSLVSTIGSLINVCLQHAMFS